MQAAPLIGLVIEASAQIRNGFVALLNTQLLDEDLLTI
jgi:hypothetical protein